MALQDAEHVLAIEASPEHAAAARRRLARHGCRVEAREELLLTVSRLISYSTTYL